MPRVLLARHGTHDEVGRILSGRSEIALNARGQAEAAWLAEFVAAHPIAAIYSSPRRRACETATPVAQGRDLSVEIAAELDEIDFGEWTGATFRALEQDERWRAWNARRGASAAPGGETMAAAVARARGFLDALPDAPALCVSHCDVIRGVVASYLGLDLDRLLSFDCDPGSVTTLELWPGGGRVVALNERPRR